ncbi:MAG: hypothetical protein L0Y71_05605 [Gemmataceae bacterium]|nr:hypothetical protein [Gemmataceae bacterium]
MKGAAGFLVGIIGFCFFAAVSLLVPLFLRRGEGALLLLFVVVVAFVFLNVLVVGFYRMMSQLHDTVVYPDDPYSHPLRGRGLFFTGYVGLLATLVVAVLVTVMQAFPLLRFRGREVEIILFMTWFVGWTFTGCLLGGVLMLLYDIHHKAFYRTLLDPPGDGYGDEFDISRRGSRARARRAEDDERPRQRRWEE